MNLFVTTPNNVKQASPRLQLPACPLKYHLEQQIPPSRLDIKQPVSKQRREKSPCVRADPLVPIPLPHGQRPVGLQVPSRVALGEMRVLQGHPKPLAQSRPAAREPIAVASGHGWAEPRPAHRRFPVVTGSGPVAGVIPPPPRAWEPQTGCPPAEPCTLSLGVWVTMP